MNDIQVITGLCGDEDPEYLFIEYFQQLLQEAIFKSLKEAQAIT